MIVSLLTPDTLTLSNVPRLADVRLLQRILQNHGIDIMVAGKRAGQTGMGDGTIVMRGFLKPPAFWEQSAGDKSHFSRGLRYQGAGQIELEKAPAGYLYDVITHGYGGMASYSAQIPPKDRWAIVAYIRALQKARASTATVAVPAATNDADPKGAH